MAILTISETASYLAARDNFCILTHRRPDGDALGSAALLCRGLRQLGKTAHILENPETTPDLRWAKVYVSFLQEERAKDAMAGLKSAGGYLRRELGRALQLRYTPELVWALDDSITYGAKMMKLINSLEVNRDGDSDHQ